MSDEAKETRQFGLRPGVGTSFPGRGKAKRCLRLGGDQGSPNTVDLWSLIPYICGQKYRTSVVRNTVHLWSLYRVSGVNLARIAKRFQEVAGRLLTKNYL